MENKMHLYFYHEQWVGLNEKPELRAWDIKLQDELSGAKLRILVGEADIDIPEGISLVTEQEIKAIMITGLRQEAKDLQAEMHMKLQAIEDKIGQLLCIENKAAE